MIIESLLHLSKTFTSVTFQNKVLFMNEMNPVNIKDMFDFHLVHNHFNSLNKMTLFKSTMIKFGGKHRVCYQTISHVLIYHSCVDVIYTIDDV